MALLFTRNFKNIDLQSCNESGRTGQEVALCEVRQPRNGAKTLVSVQELGNEEGREALGYL